MRWFRRQPIRVRIALTFLVVMAVLLLGSAAFIYERMQFALDRSIRDVPATNRQELAARRAHRNEALDELLVQLAVAYGATLAISGLIGYRMTRAALDPVEAMQQQASRPSSGARVQLPVPAADDELSRLAKTLNALLAESHRAVTRERQFVADASHELRTPLSHLQLQVDLALSRERSPAELREALERVRVETDRLVRLANDLLVLAQSDDGRLPIAPTRVRLDDELAKAAARFAVPHRAANAIRVAPGGEAPDVLADPDRLQQALANLIDNAFRHGADSVVLSWATTAGFAEIRVTDDGPGFNDGFAESAFDRFTKGAESRTTGGAGLGLAIVKAIANAHGGRASATNNARRGAVVAFSVPLAR